MSAQRPVTVGVVANPASGRDMRRVLGWTSVSTSSEKVNTVLRLISAMGSQGVQEVWMMPDSAGIGQRVREAADLARGNQFPQLPQVKLLAMRLKDRGSDSTLAVELMRQLGCQLVAVLGGDGTHRAAALGAGDLPMATLSTGTNNAFPDVHDATAVGLASALLVTGRVSRGLGLRANKRLRVLGPGVDATALVDVCVSRQLSTGGRAVWLAQDLSELFVAFAEPTALGLSSIAALAHPVSRRDSHGSHIVFGPGRILQAMVMPGSVASVGVSAVNKLDVGQRRRICSIHGTVAFDGERELEIDPQMTLDLEIDWGGPRTLEVEAILAHAAKEGLLFNPPGPLAWGN